jgi:hypothetical protein
MPTISVGQPWQTSKPLSGNENQTTSARTWINNWRWQQVGIAVHPHSNAQMQEQGQGHHGDHENWESLTNARGFAVVTQQEELGETEPVSTTENSEQCKRSPCPPRKRA